MQNRWPTWDSLRNKWNPKEVQYSAKDVDFISDSESEIDQSGSVRPDWRKWKSMRSVSIDCAVLLALDLNPDVFESFSWGDAPESVKALREVSSTLKHLFKPHYGYRTVDLVEYGSYARSHLKHLLHKGLLPMEFPREGLKALPTSFQSDGIGNKKDEVDGGKPVKNPPYMTPKLKALFKIMEAIQKNSGVKTKVIVMNMTGLMERDAQIITSLIEPNPDGRARRPWPCESDDYPSA